jgi:hypothetical protein
MNGSEKKRWMKWGGEREWGTRETEKGGEQGDEE